MLFSDIQSYFCILLYYVFFERLRTMRPNKKLKFILPTMCILLALLLLVILLHPNHSLISAFSSSVEKTIDEEENSEDTEDDYIKWVDFNVSTAVLNLAYDYDVESQEEEVTLNWIELLAYAACKGGGTCNKKSLTVINDLAESLKTKEATMESLTKDMKYYDYYYEAYSAILGGLVGTYEIEEADEQNPEETVWVEKYGLKAFSPIAKGFPYSDYDDFGVSRSYGYVRNHLGHDMMGQIGTPNS